MVTHKRLQHYNRHYCKACMTGSFGCRWHRYQQSKDDTHPKDFVWLGVSAATFLFVMFWFYFWLIANNSHDNINWFMFEHLGSWFDWHYLFLCLASVAFTYVVLLMILALLHVAHGQELYMHWIHKVVVILCIAGCIASAIFIEEYWREGYRLFELSLQVTGPFLHIGAVVIVTFLTWFIAENWMYLIRTGVRVCWLGVYIMLLLCLYLAPLIIKSPCVFDGALPSAPRVLAHRGAAAVAPENTLIAFTRAAEVDLVVGLETDVSISWDGVPFLLHDKTLRRTTNVGEVFGARVDEDASRFNISELQQLDAGSWFLHRDPHRMGGGLTESQKTSYRNQTIPTLTEALQIAKNNSLLFMFDIKFYEYGPPEDHPFHDSFMEPIEEAVRQSGIPENQILWLYGGVLQTSLNFTEVAKNAPSVPDLQERGVSRVNARYDVLSWDRLSEYQENNVSSNVFVVDSRWLHSLYSCAGIDTITSNNPDYFTGINSPSWYMSSSLYLTTWLVTDILSCVIVIAIFIVQRIRKNGKEFHPETVSLQAAKSRMSQLRQSRNMKEKLLRTAEGMHESEPGIVGTHMTPLPSPGPSPGPSPSLGPSQEVYDISGGMRGSVSSDGGSSYGGITVQGSNDIRLKEVHLEVT